MKRIQDATVAVVTEPAGTTRRELLAVGGATRAATLFTPPTGRAQVAGTAVRNGGTKPVYVPAADDPVSHSIADTLFWTDQLAEHASFFVMLMPGRELAGRGGPPARFRATLAPRAGRPHV